ncbi:helix-turn-helix transcriptional regulator [Tundrisphaera lichenicola]|uniref:helix-turn-helix transcriptional regulator n=1 Tax=Tundrisphaera lichenicola TaxID=2029860 RepID=UPI003EC06323
MDRKIPPEDSPGWTFLSNHGHVLLSIARDPGLTLREVAGLVGITERAVQRIVADLEAAGYLERVRAGRRNRYEVHPERPLRHPIEAHRDVGALLALVIEDGKPSPSETTPGIESDGSPSRPTPGPSPAP